MDTPEGRGTVVEVNLLRQQVKVRMENEPDVIHAFSNEDIAILRNGKAKKTDPPIPADLAPISGSGKRVRKEVKMEDAAFLDPIKFRYREEAVVEESTPEPVQEQEEAVEGKHSNRRRRNRGKVRGEKPATEAPAPAEVSETQSEPADKPQKPHHRRRYNHHRRKNKSGGE